MRRTPPWLTPARKRAALHGCCAGFVLWAGGATLSHAETYTQSDFGGVGLLQSPTARMAQEGEFSFVLSRATPYTNYNVSMQPLPWLEGSFRYTNVSNRPYGPANLSGSQTYKDKSIDAKIRLWEESRWLPTVAVGARDIGGTGLFSSEYIVTGKRVGPLDFSLGLAWGYIGNRGDIANPLNIISDRFRTRPSSGTGATGALSINTFLRGRPGFFGGVEYRSPWDWLILKAELDGNDYKHQPQANNQPQRWPVNLGAVFRLNHNVDLTLGYERGKVATAALNLHANLATHVDPVKSLDPKPESVAFTSTPVTSLPDATAPAPAPDGVAVPTRKAPDQVDWQEMARSLNDNAGISVSSIRRRGSELVIHGQQDRFFYASEGVGRATRIVDNRVDSSIDWVTVSAERNGLNTVDTSVHRPRFLELLDNRIDLPTFRRAIEQDPVTSRDEEMLYRAPLKRFTGGTSLGYQQNLGGPDAFVLYQVYGAASGTFNVTRNVWLDGVLAVNIANNYDKFKYDAPSNLPRVRTNVRQYLTSSDITM
ncbi:MAG: YjbH domain-containing protein, partial [Luteibacter sp.]